MTTMTSNAYTDESRNLPLDDSHRFKLFSELFGNRRRVDMKHRSAHNNNPFVPNKIEDIVNLDLIMKVDVTADYMTEPVEQYIDDDMLSNKAEVPHTSKSVSNGFGYKPVITSPTTKPTFDRTNKSRPNLNLDENMMAGSQILTEKTHIRTVSDTRLNSSTESTPMNSPQKNSEPVFNMNHQQYKDNGHRNAGNFTNTPSFTPTNSTQNVSNNRSTSLQDEQIRRTKSGFLPVRKPSLPQLALAGLKKQTSFSSSTSPVQSSKKSPLQGFGLFTRPTSKDVQEMSSTPDGFHGNQHSIQQNQPLLQVQNNENGSNSRSMSISSTTLRNLKSSFQSRKLSQRNDTFTQSSDGFQVMSPQTGGYGMVSSSNSAPVGLGLKSRNSSVSLMSKRYTSNSSASVSYRQASSASLSSSKQFASISRKPKVYPALLSKVATTFKSTIQLGENKKDGLLYRESFTGQMAVNVICSILRTNDRNLALLLGRSLDAQKFFHDVIYEHRLRDSPNEVYEFTDNLRMFGTNGSSYPPLSANDPLSLYSTSTNVESLHYQSSTTTLNTLHDSHTFNQLEEENPSTRHNVNGVFTLLSGCYSPTCTRDRLCYSISCPRRLEQQARLNLKPNGGLKRNFSVNLEDDEEERQSWTSSVPEEVWRNLPKSEIKRQEAIFEVFSTEKSFIKSLEITKDTFMKTLSETNIIPADIRKNFIKHVFAHINDIYSVNRRFLEALCERQKASPVVRGIADIILRFIPFFEPFVSYVASRPYAKYLIETQRSVNPYFARFDDDMMSSSLRHGIDSFLSQGVSRPGRYMLLVKEILKSTDPEKDQRDYEYLTKAMDAIRDFMSKIDKASGAAQDRHDVKLLKQKILFKNEYVNLGLNDEKRKIKHEGILSRKELTKSDNTVVGDIQFYLLDNLLLFLKAKSVNKWHQHKVFQRPIPLQLLFAIPGEDAPNLKKYIGSKPDCSGTVLQPDYNPTNPKNAITFLYYGAKLKYQVTLYAVQYAGLQTLLEKIKQEQLLIIKETSMINITKISDKFFDYTNKINSVVSCDGGRKLLIATNSGLYMSNMKRQQGGENQKAQILFSTPVQLIQRSNITQVGVLEEFKSILILIDKKLYSCPIALLTVESSANSYFKRHSKELINHVNFFAEGDCNGKRLVVTANSHSIKYFEHEHPMLTDSSNSSSNSKSFKKSITEVAFDSEPVSISFLKANLCIGCKKGFQIVSVFRNAHESLLDSADTSLEFALKDTLKPMAIYRVGNMFLLCYTEFAFFVNNQGWRKKDSNIINWEGEPQKFAIWYPYILAFDSNFIEIRNIDTGELVRCILGEKIRLLQSSSQEILYVYEDCRGYDTVASLDFWG